MATTDHHFRFHVPHRHLAFLELLEANTKLTQATQELTTRIELLTAEVHQQICQP